VPPELSVVIPVLNEAPNLEALHQQFSAALQSTARPYELIIVDDGSTDASYEVLKTLQARDRHLRVIRFRRNFGQTAAFAAGIAAARGGSSSLLTGIFRTIPRICRPCFVRSIVAQISCAAGGKDRKDPFLTRRLPSIVANRLDLLGHRREAE
jgi:glycosyltransferase involved in cell wall biosynthesis